MHAAQDLLEEFVENIKIRVFFILFTKEINQLLKPCNVINAKQG